MKLKHLLKPTLIFALILPCSKISAQIHKKEKTVSHEKEREDDNEEEEEGEDIAFEIKHKSMAWFQNMKTGADYFAVKKNFEKYFGNHRWEKSKPRQLGENWLKSRIYYLDNQGRVQDEPTMPARPNVAAQGRRRATQNTVGSWSMLGPVNSASTNYSNRYNHGGYVYLNRIDPTNPQKMFVSFVTGGLWVTTDGGTSFTLTDTNLPDDSYFDLDVCSSNPLVVYAVSKNNIIKSTDGGFTWNALSRPVANFSGQGYDIAVSPNDANLLLVHWGTKLVKTADGGATWTTVQSGLPAMNVWDCSITSEMLDWSINPATPGVVYSLSTSGNNQVTLYRSADYGSTFTAIKTITLDAAAKGTAIGWAKLFFPKTSPNSIYVAVGSGANPYGHQAVQLYKLDATTGTQQLARINMIAGDDTNFLHHGDISMDPYNENNIVYGTYSEDLIHYSTDNGVSFIKSAGRTHSDIRSIDFVNGRVLIGSDGEASLSTDGGVSYNTITNSISNHELWGFGSAFKTDISASGNNHGPVMIKEPGNGFDWYNGTGADQGNTDVNPLDDRYVYSQGYSNYRYFRTGVHTLENQANLLDIGGIYSYFNSIEFHPNYYYTIITHHAGQYPNGNPNLAVWKNSLIKTEDNGNSLSIVKTFSNQVFREKISMKNPKTMYVVVGLSNNKLWKTIDGGNNWTDITPSTTTTSGQVNISDIAVGDENANEVWVSYSGVQSACKIIKSNDGGTSWTNLTQPILTTFPATKLIFQRGSNGGVYLGNKSGIYYRNNSMANWVMLGNGLPLAEIRFMFINYNQGKLKIGTSRGAFEHNLYETSPPNALISASTAKVNCPYTEKVQFKDYSVVRNASATWAWSFPGGTPSTSNLENPIVSYKGAADGFYNVSLTVTDALGTSTQTIPNFIQVASNCGTGGQDTIPGNALKLQSNGDCASPANPLNISTNTFTTTAWVKPIGAQTSYAGLMFMRSAIGNKGTGLYITTDNTLRFSWNEGGYNFNPGMALPDNQWSHIAMVVNATGVTIYVNGVGVRNTRANATVTFDAPFKIGIDPSNNSRTFKGEMDEITFYNRALSQNEIREQMYLTKNNPTGSPATDPALLGYFQFNETPGLGQTYDKTGGNIATFSGTAALTTSNAPVGGGVSFRKTSINTGANSFGNTGINLNFSSGTLPNAEILAVKLNVKPNVANKATFALPPAGGYWIVNNFSTASYTATAIATLNEVQGTTAEMATTPSKVSLFARAANAFADWGNVLGTATALTDNNGTGNITFGNSNLASFGQFSLGSVEPTVLPIALISFTAKPISSSVKVSWTVANAKQFKQFEVERSIEGKTFTGIKNLSYNRQANYEFSDENLAVGTYYYRLKLVDENGEYTYSEIRSAIVNGYNADKVTLYPNPVKDVLHISYPNHNKLDIGVSVYNVAGKLMFTKNIRVPEGEQNITIDVANLPVGAYFINLKQGENKLYFKVLKQ